MLTIYLFSVQEALPLLEQGLSTLRRGMALLYAATPPPVLEYGGAKWMPNPHRGGRGGGGAGRGGYAGYGGRGGGPSSSGRSNYN